MTLVAQNWYKPVHGEKIFKVIERLKWLIYNLKLLNHRGFNDQEVERRKWKARLEKDESTTAKLKGPLPVWLWEQHK